MGTGTEGSSFALVRFLFCFKITSFICSSGGMHAGGMPVEVRGLLAGAGSLLPPWGPRDWTQATGLSNE